MALLDHFLLLIRVALLGRGHERGIDDLPAHRDVACLTQRRVEPIEQRLDGASLGQLLAKQPDRAGVWHAISKAQAKEAHEREPVVDEELSTYIRLRS